MLSHALELSCPKTAECPIYIGPWVQGNKEVHLVPSQRSCIWLYLIVPVFDCPQFSSKSFITLSQAHLHCNDFGEKFWRIAEIVTECLTPLDTSLLPCHMDLVGGPPSRAPESPSWRNLRLHRLHSLDSFWICFFECLFLLVELGQCFYLRAWWRKSPLLRFSHGGAMQLVEVSPGDSLADLFDAGIPNIGYEISRLDFVFTDVPKLLSHWESEQHKNEKHWETAAVTESTWVTRVPVFCVLIPGCKVPVFKGSYLDAAIKDSFTVRRLLLFSLVSYLQSEDFGCFSMSSAFGQRKLYLQLEAIALALIHMCIYIHICITLIWTAMKHSKTKYELNMDFNTTPDLPAFSSGCMNQPRTYVCPLSDTSWNFAFSQLQKTSENYESLS